MTSFLPPSADDVRRDVERALAEDIGSGDATASLIDRRATASASVITREAAILCGRPWFDACFLALDAGVRIEWQAEEGAPVNAGQQLCSLHGNARALLSGERCALNFLQTLSATATVTARHVAAVHGTRAVILDTRKTLPGLRVAQKYAVRCGGGANHRVGLFDAILIKENHIAAAGSLGAAVRAARALHPRLAVETEVETFAELDQALAAGVDRIMLDEFSLADMRKAVDHVGGRVALEASGGVGLDRLRAIAETGVDFISIGALTKHVHAIDLSMRIRTEAANQIRPR
jgi:nicotinate-nucleotide pyrophosphorylase (carboxylating)